MSIAFVKPTRHVKCSRKSLHATAFVVCRVVRFSYSEDYFVEEIHCEIDVLRQFRCLALSFV